MQGLLLGPAFEFAGNGQKDQGGDKRSVKRGQYGHGHGRTYGSRIIQPGEHLDQAYEGPDHAEAGSECAHFFENVLNNGVPASQGGNFNAQGLGYHHGVSIVGNELTGFFQYRVFGLDFFQGQKAVPAAYFSYPDHGVDHVVGGDAFAGEYVNSGPESLDYLAYGKIDAGGRKSSSDNDHHAWNIDKSFYCSANKNCSDNQGKPDYDP